MYIIFLLKHILPSWFAFRKTRAYF